MSALIIDQLRSDYVIITLTVRVRILRPESVAKWPEIYVKLPRSHKVTLAKYA